MGGSTDKPTDDRPAEGGVGSVQPAPAVDHRADSSDGPRASFRRSTIQKLAHELKTPISAIAACSEIMRDERFGPIGDQRYRTYAADIHESARLMLGVIDRMLAHRGLEPAQQPMAFSQIDAGAVVAATVSTLETLAERAGIELVLEQDERLPHLIADSTSLKQILINLLTNALKFTPHGGSIRVETRYGEDGPLVIAVTDTGCGMTESEVAAALAGEAAGESSRPGQGLGLGLPLVKALAEANGGTIEVDSRPGAGTCVRVVFGKNRLLPV